MSAPLLQVEDLHVQFATRDGVVRAVNGMSFSLNAGETIAILGESGSGKSVTAQAVMGILDKPIASITKGSILFQGTELVGMPEKQHRKLRGEKMSMIFQDALSALNPVLTVGDQVAEMFTTHQGASRSSAKKQAIEVMEHVGIPDAARRYKDYPHQFSGGMRQRIMIAMMIGLRPALLIADEPTTALDVTVQSQIMELLGTLQRETGTGLILITHDLGVVAATAQRIVVMYSGRVMEQGLVDDIYARPANPYTVGLMDSIPRLDVKSGLLPAIPGLPPNLLSIPPGCAFNPRCSMRAAECVADPHPPLMDVGVEHRSACWFANEVHDGRR